MRAYRNTIFLIIAVILVILVMSGPCRSRGTGLKGIIDSGGTGPTWITQVGDKMFVSNTASSSIEVFSTKYGDIDAHIKDITNAGLSKYSSKTKRLYVCAGRKGAGMLLAIDPATNKIEQQLNMELECRAVDVSSDGKYVFAVWGGWKEGPGWLTMSSSSDFNDLKAVTGTRESPTAIVLSKDGSKAYVVSHYGQQGMEAWLNKAGESIDLYSVVEIFSIEEGNLEMIKEIRVGLKPQSMVMFGEGQYIIVSSTAFENPDLGLPALTVIDTQTDEIVKTVDTPGLFPFIVVADDKLGMAFASYIYKVEPPADAEKKPEEKQPDAAGQGDVDEKQEPYGMYGKGFLAINLETFDLSIYEDKNGLPLASLCVLDDGRIVGVSSVANKLVILEPVKKETE